MSYTPEDVVRMTKNLERHLSVAQGMVSDLATAFGQIAHSIPLKDASEWRCPKCGVDKKSETYLSEHMEIVHHVRQEASLN